MGFPYSSSSSSSYSYSSSRASISFSFISQARSNLQTNSCCYPTNIKFNHNISPQRDQILGSVQSLSRKRILTWRQKKSPPTIVVPLLGGNESGETDDNDEEEEKGDFRALETVLKLYTAIRNRNLGEMSEIIGEECRCGCNLVSTFQPFHGKKQVLDFFSSLMRHLGNDVELVIQPTLHDGMSVGVSWKLECKKTHAPLGKGFSFHICHMYQGKVMIRNMEMFMEPLFHIEPLRLKVMAFAMNLFVERRKARILCALLALVLIILHLWLSSK